MKKTILLSLFATSLLILTAFTNDNTDSNSKTDVRLSQSWIVDKPHSSINFSVRHFFTPVNGRFDNFHADILFDAEDLENSRLDVTIPIESINTQNEKRDNHLKSEDFFNAGEWPNIRFESHTIEQTGENQYVAHGALTIRDETRNFELPFELLGIMDHPMKENTKVAGFSANTTLNRTDFGVGVGDWAATMVVGDEVDIQLNVELNSQ